MKKTIFLVFLLVGFYSTAQNNFIKGTVLNSVDSLPLAYVNIYCNTYKFGTITNELGEYLLNYPDSLTSFKVSFSSIGFSSKELLLEDIKDTIYLQPSQIMLDEVVIRNVNTDIEFVLDKVYENIKNNYSNKRHLLKAFYRQVGIQTKDSSYLRVIEADIGIQEYGILKALDRDRIKINHYRKSDDKITKKWYLKVVEKMSSHPNFLFWLKKKDFVKNFVKYKNYHMHYKNILKNYEFEFLEYQNLKDDLVAVYSFYPKSRKGIINEEHKSKLYINLKDYAIISVVKYMVYGKSSNPIVFASEEYYYTKIGDYYYLNNAINRRFLTLSTEIDKEMLIDQLYVYQVETDRENYKKIKRKEKEEITGDVYKKDIALDTTFWNTYTMLPIVPLKDQLKALLQQDKSLEKQYLDNGKKQ